MMKRFLLVLGVSTAIMLVVTACGGTNSTPTPPPQPTATPRSTVTSRPPTPTPQPVTSPTPTVVSANTGPEPRYGGVLQARWYRDFRQWDTWHAAGGYSTAFTKDLMSNLVQYEPGSLSKIKADLAQTWEQGADGKTFTFHLAKNVQWHDGRPLTAKDVQYTFKRGSDPQYTFNKGRVDPIQTIETPDDYTVKITIKDVSNSFLPAIATPFVLIYPSHITDMSVWAKAPLGTGPFKFVSDKPNEAYTFTKNPSYFSKDAQGRQLPYLDGVVWNVIVDKSLALSALRSGRLQCGCGFDTDFLDENEAQLRKDIPGVKFGTVVGLRQQVYFNTRKPPFDNLAFRQAVAIGLDKASIGATYKGGKNFVPAPTLLPVELGGQWALPKSEMEKIPGYNTDHAADLKIAFQKLKESGIDPKGVKLTFNLSGSFSEAVGDLVATFLTTDLGIETKVSAATSLVEDVERRQNGNFQFFLMNEDGSIDDPLDWYRDFISTRGDRNWGGYSNPRLDSLLQGQDRELDATKRKQMLWEVQRIELSDYPKFAVMWGLSIRGSWPEVMNFKVGPLNVQNFDLSEVWLSK